MVYLLPVDDGFLQFHKICYTKAHHLKSHASRRVQLFDQARRKRQMSWALLHFYLVSREFLDIFKLYCLDTAIACADKTPRCCIPRDATNQLNLGDECQKKSAAKRKVIFRHRILHFLKILPPESQTTRSLDCLCSSWHTQEIVEEVGGRSTCLSRRRVMYASTTITH